MKYFCAELEGLKPSELIYNQLIETHNSKIIDYDTMVTKYTYDSSIYTINGGKSYNYNNSYVNKYFNTFIVDITFKNVSSFSSYTGLNIIDYTGLSNTYKFNIQNIDDFYCNIFYTILTETGIILTKPVRQTFSKNRGILQDIDIILNLDKSVSSLSFFGESTVNKISNDNKYIIPAIVDNNIKTAVLNKYKSKLNIITWQTSNDYDCLDFIHYGLYDYIILSKMKVSNNVYQYTAAKESNETFSFSGSSFYNDKTKIDVYQSSTNNVNTGTFTTNIFNVETYDTLSEYNNATGEFIPKTTKICSLTCGISVVYGITTGKLYIITLYKDETEYKRLNIFHTTTTNHLMLMGSFTGEFVANSVYTIKVYHNEGSTKATFAGSSFNFMTINEIKDY